MLMVSINGDRYRRAPELARVRLPGIGSGGRR